MPHSKQLRPVHFRKMSDDYKKFAEKEKIRSELIISQTTYRRHSVEAIKTIVH